MNTGLQSQRQSHGQSQGQKIDLAWQKYMAVLQLSVANNLAYMGEVVFRAMLLLAFIFIFLQLWTATYAARGVHSLAGFSISDMIWYLAATRYREWDISQRRHFTIR